MGGCGLVRLINQGGLLESLRLMLMAALILLFLHEPARAGLPEGEGIFLTPGFTMAGVSNLEQGAGLSLGGAVHLMLYRDGFKLGSLAEVIYDLHRETPRIMVGSSIGYGIFGVDCGYVAQFDQERTRHGGACRVYASYAVRVHVGYAWMLDAPDFVEFGLQIKLPFSLDGWKLGLPLW